MAKTVETIFEFADYKSVIRGALRLKRERFGARYTAKRLAEHCRIQDTYLSRVMNGPSHLSADQVFRASQYLELSTDEKTYLTLIHEAERTEVPERRQQLSSEAEKLILKYQRLETHLKAPVVKPELAHSYYLDPYLQIVHLCLLQDRFARNIQELSGMLGISSEYVEHLIKELLRLNLIEHFEDRYVVTQSHFHLGVDSPIFRMYRILLRVLTLERLQKSSAHLEDYHFSVLFCADEKTRQTIRKKLLALIKEAEPLVTGASKKRVYQMNLDLFSWT